MARNQWQQWMLSPFYPGFVQAQPVYPSGNLYERVLGLVQPGAGARLLLAGCGNGSKAQELAATGFDLTGTDYADSLIQLAKPLEQDNLHFYQHDLRLPFWSNYFGLAFVTSRSFGVYDTKREHDNLVRTIAGSLTPGGYLLMEYINTHYLEQHPFTDEEQDIDGSHYNIVHLQDEKHFYSTITVTDPSLTAPEVYIHKKEKFTAGDFTEMLADQGLQVQELFGDDELGAYDINDSPKLIVLAKKMSAEKGDAEKRLYSDGRTTDPLT